MTTCVFCKLIEQGKYERGWGIEVLEDVLITPMNPVTQGHKLIIPVEHVHDAGSYPPVTARVMGRAAEYALSQRLAGEFECFNIITSAGGLATQTVYHLHVHVVPRRADDGLLLPWSNQRR